MGRLFLGRLVERRASDKRHGPLFDLCPYQFRAQLRAAADGLRLNESQVTPYVLRHTGASNDFLAKIRALPEIQRRGRWQSPSLLRRYEKHSLITARMQELVPEVKHLCAVAAQELALFMATGGCQSSSGRLSQGRGYRCTIDPGSVLGIGAPGPVVSTARLADLPLGHPPQLVLRSDEKTNADRLVQLLPLASHVHLATLCARRCHVGAPGGPLRSRQHSWGVPGLTPTDQDEVRTGNALARVTCRIMEKCCELRAQNPLLNQLWRLPRVRLERTAGKRCESTAALSAHRGKSQHALSHGDALQASFRERARPEAPCASSPAGRTSGSKELRRAGQCTPKSRSLTRPSCAVVSRLF